MIEEWKEIKGYEGYYKVSNLGNVIALERIIITGAKIGSRIVTKRKDNHGYYHVGLNRDGKETTRRIHRLVAQAFIPNIRGKPFIDHINTIRTDNRVENLRWVTPKENNENTISIRKYKITLNAIAKSGVCRSVSKRVLEYNLNGEFVREWRCARFISDKLGLKDSSFVYACSDGKKSHYRNRTYRWKLSDNFPRIIDVGIDEKKKEILNEKYERYQYQGKEYTKGELKEMGIIN